MAPPTVLAVHDLSGFGRGSLTTAITVLGAMGIQACPLPTSLLSSNTHIPGFTFFDLSEQMEGFITHWQKLGLKFDVIYSGFLGSAKQCALVKRCMDIFSHGNTVSIIDPVLGDNGALYPTMDSAMVHEMRSLVACANIITPNLTEAALLLGEDCPQQLTRENIINWLERLGAMGPETVVITSAMLNDEPPSTSSVVAHNRHKDEYWQVKCDHIPAHYPGTGDIFASVLCGSLLWKEELPVAIARAMRFVATGIERSEQEKVPSQCGIVLEEVLGTLKGPLSRTYSQPLRNTARTAKG